MGKRASGTRRPCLQLHDPSQQELKNPNAIRFPRITRMGADRPASIRVIRGDGCVNRPIAALSRWFFLLLLSQADDRGWRGLRKIDLLDDLPTAGQGDR